MVCSTHSIILEYIAPGCVLYGLALHGLFCIPLSQDSPQLQQIAATPCAVSQVHRHGPGAASACEGGL